MTLRDLPSVRALAEERANDLHLRLFGRPTDGERLAQWREAHLDLLTDLSRADSRDAVARLVAAKAGIECGATAPQWAQEEYHVDGERTACWILSSKDRSVVFYGDYDSGPDGYSVYRRVSGVDNITDPAEALARVAIVVLA